MNEDKLIDRETLRKQAEAQQAIQRLQERLNRQSGKKLRNAVYGSQPFMNGTQHPNCRTSVDLAPDEATVKPLANFTVEDGEQAYECAVCESLRPSSDDSSRFLLRRKVMSCYGDCGGDGTTHTPTGVLWEPVRLDVSCPRCEYETRLYEEPEEWPPECPDCEVSSGPSDDYAVLTNEPESLPPGHIDATEAKKALTHISGITGDKARNLVAAGYHSLDDLRWAEMDELTEVEGIGQAHAARIKSQVGDIPVRYLKVENVVLDADVDR